MPSNSTQLLCWCRSKVTEVKRKSRSNAQSRLVLLPLEKKKEIPTDASGTIWNKQNNSRKILEYTTVLFNGTVSCLYLRPSTGPSDDEALSSPQQPSRSAGAHLFLPPEFAGHALCRSTGWSSKSEVLPPPPNSPEIPLLFLLLHLAESLVFLLQSRGAGSCGTRSSSRSRTPTSSSSTPPPSSAPALAQVRHSWPHQVRL
jgi:hypothetical protein